MFFANWLGSLRRLLHRPSVSRRGRRVSAGQLRQESGFESRIELLEQRQLLTVIFFGDDVVPLSTGNVLTLGRGGIGSVALWNGTTGELISMLVGSSEGDFAGSQITALANGNFVVAIPKWDNGLAVDAGAVTWGSGLVGVAGTVSSANSLVGTTTNDQVGGDGGFASYRPHTHQLKRSS